MNQFNFSERASQTQNNPFRVRMICNYVLMHDFHVPSNIPFLCNSIPGYIIVTYSTLYDMNRKRFAQSILFTNSFTKVNTVLARK